MKSPDRSPLHGQAETLVLALLARHPAHGYQLRQELATRSHAGFDLGFGTLYPLLRSLERQGLVTAHWAKTGRLRKRREYTLTARGARALRAQTAAWRRFVAAMNRVLARS